MYLRPFSSTDTTKTSARKSLTTLRQPTQPPARKKKSRFFASVSNVAYHSGIPKTASITAALPEPFAHANRNSQTDKVCCRRVSLQCLWNLPTKKDAVKASFFYALNDSLHMSLRVILT